jgi:hypothetical protein
MVGVGGLIRLFERLAKRRICGFPWFDSIT